MQAGFSPISVAAALSLAPLVAAGTMDPAIEGAIDTDIAFYDRAPYLQSLTADSVMIVSQTREESLAQLHLSGSGEEQSIAETKLARGHVFRIGGLTPHTEYSYRLTQGNGQTFEASFETLPEPGTGVTIAALGDCGYRVPGEEEHEIEDQRRIAALLSGLGPRIPLLLQTGDLVTPGTFFSTVQFACFDIYRDLLMRCCMFPALGNHDALGGYDAPWLAIFHTPANNRDADETYYSVDVGDAHIAVVNSLFLSDRQLSWLVDDLAGTDRTWRIMTLHHPPYGTVHHFGNEDVRQNVMPIANALHVDLVLTGHNHVYERFFPVFRDEARDAGQDPHYRWPKGTLVVTTGGGGAPLYERTAGANVANTPDLALSARYERAHHFLTIRITPAELEVAAIKADGSELDRFSIRKDGPRPPASFIRGDANDDGAIDLADAVGILMYLFRVESAISLPCVAACDANSSGSINVADPVFLLACLFSHGPVMGTPFPECGTVNGSDATGCGRCAASE